MIKSPSKDVDVISLNKLAHDVGASTYDESHVEIYNPVEQARLRDALGSAICLIETASSPKKVLDFGSGTGNLTMHLWQLGADVVASDVSSESLNHVSAKIGSSKRFSTILLNGEDLNSISDNTFDMVATYSVLHHVPDYMKIVDEFVRVVKPGGIIFIDHEVTPSYWELNQTYNDYLTSLGGLFLQHHLYEIGALPKDKKHFPGLRRVVKKIVSVCRHRQPQPIQVSDSGDIHVFKHDHIQWEKIHFCLESYCEVLTENDYLVCRERSEEKPAWTQWKGKCSDMRVMVARKRST